MLCLPNMDLPFEVQTNVSTRALGGVLVQEGHPIAFESRKLNEAEIKQAAKLDSTYEKLKQPVKKGTTRKYWLEDDLLVVKGGKLSVPGTPHACPGEEATRLFLNHVVKYFGLPKDIVNNRDARFTCWFWTKLFKLLGSELKFSTTNHPQIDGQTKQINALFEEYLRHYVIATQKN
ncbi:hypothetical protein CK203_090505 [Vitis vinifera]|uniref:Reverse transcriptase/retrotransposon-derived protein RNase H-like domain-containing protein n=1 Tax=Vitis vinifera TaxID=29760 RepID=A0A438BU13_VITVI|nr:hypothetical protein CK203_090505 [Vitis vinifera]